MVFKLELCDNIVFTYCHTIPQKENNMNEELIHMLSIVLSDIAILSKKYLWKLQKYECHLQQQQTMKAAVIRNLK